MMRGIYDSINLTSGMISLWHTIFGERNITRAEARLSSVTESRSTQEQIQVQVLCVFSSKAEDRRSRSRMEPTQVKSEVEK